MLLKFGADVNYVGYDEHFSKLEDHNYKCDDIFPLMAVTKQGYPSEVESLLEGGADVNQRNSIGQTALHAAIGWSGFELSEILLRYKADPNLKDNDGKTPLDYAFESKQINQLIEAGARTCTVNDYNFDKLHLIAQSTGQKLAEAEIEAYEHKALSLAQSHYEGSGRLELALENMQKATSMREEHNLPKTVATPLECYDFAKEWETLEELNIYRDSHEAILVQAMLARERLYQGKCIILQPMTRYVVLRNPCPPGPYIPGQ